MNESEIRSQTPSFPLYSSAQHFLKIIAGVRYSLYRNMYNLIYEQRGNPQETVEWTEPNTWIQEGLTGDERNLALHLWDESRGELNPRHLRGV